MEKKKYKVVEAFELSVLQEVGSIVELTDEQANSGAIGPKVEPVTEEEQSDAATGDDSNEEAGTPEGEEKTEE